MRSCRKRYGTPCARSFGPGHCTSRAGGTVRASNGNLDLSNLFPQIICYALRASGAYSCHRWCGRTHSAWAVPSRSAAAHCGAPMCASTHPWVTSTAPPTSHPMYCQPGRCRALRVRTGAQVRRRTGCCRRSMRSGRCIMLRLLFGHHLSRAWRRHFPLTRYIEP